MAKRIFDILFSGIGLLVCAPAMLVIALLVKWTSRGPVFFRQERVGLGFAPFEILKFRTMVPEAPQQGRAITASGDPRITSVGKLLRRLKLDELPQLVNVFRGEMSIVGPRPEVPKYVEEFRQDYEELLRVRPGITDLASLQFRDEESLLAGSQDPELLYISEILPNKIALSKKYLANATLASDIRVLCTTVLTIVIRFIPFRKTCDRNPQMFPSDG